MNVLFLTPIVNFLNIVFFISIYFKFLNIGNIVVKCILVKITANI